ncbi:hypothetical protein H2248_004632 [Termitomyces sp. 'cryptogamus']|nr:hypothetical protein H2248_004632 [Termitomyces sp. 'cryptogamus']
MRVNALTAETGFKVGPVVLETLVKHYFERRKTGNATTQLRQDELMYDEVFNVVKSFLRLASFHTVEDVQGFANTRTPSPPSVHVVRLLIPMTSCDEAAQIIITAFGGKETAKRVVGGVKWWQVRGINGVDAQWITAKKDWENAQRRTKMQKKAKEDSSGSLPSTDLPTGVADSEIYEKHMDEMRCILYSHGGGYYFGSVDQERYSIQRHARKINGRVFAVNYRLAPQYPFPCALQDLVAAYLYLIRPPPCAAHCPVNPAHIIIAGDSAGGGLSLALLQVLRDSGLPMPAGGVLISPWCDLTHSFSSIHTNTTTDVLPEWGLSLQKPSVLWPPPPDDISKRVHASLRTRIREVFRTDQPYDPTATMLSMAQSTSAGQPVDVGATTSLPTSDPQHIDQTVSLVARSGEILSTSNQLHLYTQNSLLAHPLVSPVVSYLGGLPPLLFIVSDREVLRDEIIYTAHKAANPKKYPIGNFSRVSYPSLIGIEDRCKPTKVHLQVYDDTAHVLPVLFSFTTPAKYCFRAIAAFSKHVTGIPLIPTPPSIPSNASPTNPVSRSSFNSSPESKSRKDSEGSLAASDKPHIPKRISLSRSLSSRFSRAIQSRSRFSRTFSEDNVLPTEPILLLPIEDVSVASIGPAQPPNSNTPSASHEPIPLTAGDPRVYRLSEGQWNGNMIRERVSTQGIIRPLEPESELSALIIDPDVIGRISELTLRRYLDASAMFDKKFAHTIRAIKKDRWRNLTLAKKDTKRGLAALHHKITLSSAENSNSSSSVAHGVRESFPSSGSWNWAWVLDGEERPPPSSIVSRRDTAEARHLAKIADQSLFQDDQSLSANRLWSAVLNFFTFDQDQPLSNANSTKRPSRLDRFLGRERFVKATFLPDDVKDEGHH